ncbi:MAG: PQQ-binding-like beta-propeller repeat protein, partial [Blastocatellia bacterium]|nr:PQQ-binding-like beta-propeller repeat protein [Blastocatellia bacterium]
MKSNRKLATFIVCVMVLSFAIAQGSSDRRALRDSRSVTLPTYAILDEQSEPLIASDGRVGFISSVTGGMLVSFNMKTGKVLSSIVVGKTAGPISMIETGKRRLIAVPAANEPDQGHPATISVIDATSARQLDLKALLVLPADAHITPKTRALLTEDGRYCLIASSFAVPELMSFDVETGQMVSQLPLFGRPSEVALYDRNERRAIAIVSAESNYLSVFRLTPSGQLSSAANFTPSDARFSESNNPVFSADGRAIYVAASKGDRLFAVDARSGARFGSLEVSSPQRITAIKLSDGGEMIGVTRTRRPIDNAPGGVTIATIHRGRLRVQSEFTPPDDIEFSPANNVEFDGEASVAFVGSKSGLLFAFSTETGELESHHLIGSRLNRVALNPEARAVAAVRSSPTGDEVVIVRFDVVEEDEPGELPAPVITSLKPDVAEQGRAKNLNLLVRGENFAEGAVLLVNGNEAATEQANDGTALATRLNRELFAQAGDISIQVRAANGDLSPSAALRVVRPADPVIDKIKPDEVPGPAEPFTLKVVGKNFRRSSTIFVDGQPLNTERLGEDSLRAEVSSELAGTVKRLTVQVRDLAVPDVVSNERELNVFGPRIRTLRTGPNTVVAGAGSFKLK